MENENSKNKVNLKTENSSTTKLEDYFNTGFNVNKYSEKIKKLKKLDLFKNLKISDNVYNKYGYLLWKIYLDNDSCLSSNSQKCISPNGYHFWFRITNNDKLMLIHRICPKFEKETKANSFIKNYLWYSFDSKLLNLVMNEKTVDNNYDDSRKKVLAYMHKIIKSNSKQIKGYYLYGLSGIGKTYLTILFCNLLARHDRTIAYVYIPDLVSKLVGDFNNKKYSIQDFSKLLYADILVLDDLGTETVREWFFNEYLMKILDNRNESQKTTIFISNYSLSELKKYYLKNFNKSGIDSKAVERLLSRIHGLVDKNIFNMKGEDWRKK